MLPSLMRLSVRCIFDYFLFLDSLPDCLPFSIFVLVVDSSERRRKKKQECLQFVRLFTKIVQDKWKYIVSHKDIGKITASFITFKQQIYSYSYKRFNKNTV